MQIVDRLESGVMRKVPYDHTPRNRTQSLQFGVALRAIKSIADYW